MKCLVSARTRERNARIDARGRAHTVSDIAPKVLADDDVPGGPVAPVQLLLDLRGDVLLDVVLFEGGRGDVDALLLHVLGHVDALDDRLGAGARRCAADAWVGGGGRSGVEFL